MKAKRTLLIGWDAADWKVADSLIEKGLMPTLAAMKKQGVYGNLSTLDPVLSPMLWSSIATGKFADKHGIHGFTEADYNAGLVRPISTRSRKARAIWNILTQQEKRTNVFGWWPSNPAEPINGICVSNLYQRAHKPLKSGWPMAPGTVHPPSLAAHFAQCRIHPDELSHEHILPFIPKASNVDQEKDNRIGSFSKILADAATVHAASTWAIEHTEWDFTAVYHDAIDHACHGFMKFRAPKLAPISDDLFEIYCDVVDGVYRFHDMMLERLIQLAGPDTNVILISDHGFHSDHLRPIALPKEPAAPAYEHRKHGILCCMGPDFKQGEQIFGASVIDICPTLLTLFGLPVGDDMDGTPLVQLFAEQPTIQRIPSWEDVKGNFGEHAPEDKIDPEEAKNQVKQLVELGYIEDPGEDAGKALMNTEVEAKYNLAAVYASTARPREALALYEQAHSLKPSYRFASRAVECLLRLGRYEEAIDRISVIQSEFPDEGKNSMMLKRAEILILQKKPAEAMTLLKEVSAQIGLHPALVRTLAHCHYKLKEYKTALGLYTNLLAVDPTDANLHRSVASCKFDLKDYEGAVDSALTATELLYHSPPAHVVLGQALYKLRHYEQSAQALEVALIMRPSLLPAQRLLQRIYEKHSVKRDNLFVNGAAATVLPESLDKEWQQNSDKRHMAVRRTVAPKGEVMVVSGLPRSGTSLMMQMLVAGGCQPFSDGVRAPDENNPRGFFEHELVKSLGRNNRWLSDAEGKVVKVVSQLLPNLPAGFRYKVVFMKRDLNEVVKSQHTMLVRVGKAKADAYPLKLETVAKQAYERGLKWAHTRPHTEWLEISYDQLLANPIEAAKSLVEFLGKNLDEKAMAACVDRSLYRTQR